MLNDWLGLSFVADDLQQALAMRSQLPEGGSFVVKAGHVVTRVGVQLYAADSEQAGMLARQQEIENLARQVRAQALARRRSEGRRDPRRSRSHAGRRRR